MVGRKCLADLLDRDTRLPDIRSLILVRECLLACGVVRGEQGSVVVGVEVVAIAVLLLVLLLSRLLFLLVGCFLST